MLELTGIYDGIEMTMTHNQPIRVVVEISSQSETLKKSAVSPNVHNALNLYKVYRPYRLGVRGQFKENKASNRKYLIFWTFVPEMYTNCANNK